MQEMIKNLTKANNLTDTRLDDLLSATTNNQTCQSPGNTAQSGDTIAVAAAIRDKSDQKDFTRIHNQHTLRTEQIPPHDQS